MLSASDQWGAAGGRNLTAQGPDDPGWACTRTTAIAFSCDVKRISLSGVKYAEPMTFSSGRSNGISSFSSSMRPPGLSVQRTEIRRNSTCADSPRTTKGPAPEFFEEHSALRVIFAEFYQGKLAERQGRKPDARRWLQAFLGRFPADREPLPQVREARQILARL